MVTEPHDAVIRITTAAICGSDLHMYFNEVPGVNVMQKGDVMGHEGVGIIESIGAEVTKFKVGDRVTISAVVACGRCEYCKKEQFSLCETTNPSKEMEEQYGHRLAGVFGYTHLTGGYEGTQAEFCRVPMADVNLLKLPSSVSDDKAVFLSDVCCTGWHANELGEVGKGDIVAVWGAGPIGLMSGYLAKKIRGAAEVIIVDNDEYRLSLARSTYGAQTINFDKQDVIKEIQRLYPKGVDRCIDAAGYRFAKTKLHQTERLLKLETDSSEVIFEALMVCRKGGNLSLIADYFGFSNHFPVGMLMEKGITTRGGQLWPQKYWKTLLPLIENGTIDPTFMITHTMPLEEAASAYDMFAVHADNSVKVLLKTKTATETRHKRSK